MKTHHTVVGRHPDGSSVLIGPLFSLEEARKALRYERRTRDKRWVFHID